MRARIRIVGGAAAGLWVGGLASYSSSSSSSAGSSSSTRTLACGSNSFGQLGTGDSLRRGGLSAVSSASPSIICLAAGKDSSALVTSDGLVYTFGRGNDGRLGHDGGESNVLAPRVVDNGLASEGVRIRRVALGEQHGAAISEGGALYTWGSGARTANALGRPIAPDADGGRPARVESLSDECVVDVALGRGYTVAVTSKGQVWAWGSGRGHALGLGSTKAQARPQRIALIEAPVVQVASGESHTLALTKSGAVLAWGDDARGQLGVGGGGGAERRFIRTPTPIGALAAGRLADDDVVVAVYAGAQHSAALTKRGKIYTWGRGDSGQLGHGGVARDDRPTPTQVTCAALEGRSVRGVALGGAHSAAILDDGSCVVWGEGKAGQLGLGVDGKKSVAPRQTSPTPILNIAKGETVALIACGGEHTLVVTK